MVYSSVVCARPDNTERKKVVSHIAPELPLAFRPHTRLLSACSCSCSRAHWLALHWRRTLSSYEVVVCLVGSRLAVDTADEERQRHGATETRDRSLVLHVNSLFYVPTRPGPGLAFSCIPGSARIRGPQMVQSTSVLLRTEHIPLPPAYQASSFISEIQGALESNRVSWAQSGERHLRRSLTGFTTGSSARTQTETKTRTMRVYPSRSSSRQSTTLRSGQSCVERKETCSITLCRLALDTTRISLKPGPVLFLQFFHSERLSSPPSANSTQLHRLQF